MNRPRPRARVVVRARDPLLRSLIAERLSELGDLDVEVEGARAPGARAHGAGTNGPEDADAVVEASSAEPAPTPREMEVLGLLAEGLANKEIAARLGFSAHTAKFHVESLLRKLSAANRAEAVREGIRRGLIGV
jgi:DNA-binding CsgD family transcriptional regulator